MAKTQDIPRQIALSVLTRFEKAGQERLKADSLLQDALAKHPSLNEQERGFVRALVMGTLRRWLVYEGWILALTSRPLKNIRPAVRSLLRMGLFQLEGGLSQVPAYAALNSTVELAKATKNSPPTVKFINAVLRQAQRKLEAGELSAVSNNEDFSAHLLSRFGWPEAWTTLLSAQYASSDLLAMAEAAQLPAPLSIRVNTLQTTVNEYQQLLTSQQIVFEPILDLPEGLLLPEFSGSPRNLPGYDAGLFYVQDAASMWVSRLLAPQAEERVLDLCAAPGSKTTHMAALMQNTGQIIAIDPKQERLKLLAENIQRLGVTNIQTEQVDGLAFQPAPEMLFDKVLVDAPCSGSGTLRRHPEILLQLKKLDVGAYNQLQLSLLKSGFACLKPSGALVYSTCSILAAENKLLVQRFLAETPNARLDVEEQRLIQRKTDGFYAARLIRTE